MHKSLAGKPAADSVPRGGDPEVKSTYCEEVSMNTDVPFRMETNVVPDKTNDHVLVCTGYMLVHTAMILVQVSKSMYYVPVFALDL